MGRKRRTVDRVITQMVDCVCAKGGKHPVTLGIDEEGTVVTLHAPCRPQVVDAARRLDAEAGPGCAGVLKAMRADLDGSGRMSGTIPPVFDAWDSPLSRARSGAVDERARREKLVRSSETRIGFFNRVLSRRASFAAGFALEVRIGPAPGERRLYLKEGREVVARRTLDVRGRLTWALDEEHIAVSPWTRSSTYMTEIASRYSTRGGASCAVCGVTLKTASAAQSHPRTDRHNGNLIDGIRRAITALGRGTR